MEVLFGGDDAPGLISGAAVLMEPGDNPHHVYEAPGITADAKRRGRYLDALGVGDRHVGGL